MPITLDGTNGITTPTYGGADTSEYLVPVTQFKNRIINGAMTIAQRGTSFSFASGGGGYYYGADRFRTFDYQWSAGTNPTVSNDTTVYPTGFTNSYKYATGATGLTFSSGGYQQIEQIIEGFNIADCYTGNITISFWVRASTAGQYNILLTNDGNFQRYSTRNYTINSANTWEYKTITVDLSAGIASGGTWNTTNGIGLNLNFILGAHSNRTGNTALNTWATGGSPAYDFQTTGSVNLSTIANSTFYLTGVQVEKGSTATSFDYRPYGTELELCLRYYEVMQQASIIGAVDASNIILCPFTYKVIKRATPSLALLTTTISITEPTVAGRTSSGSTLTGGTGASTSACIYQINGFSGMTNQNIIMGANAANVSILGISAEL